MTLTSPKIAALADPSCGAGWQPLARTLLAGYAVLQLALLAGLILNHLWFPLFLETMEGVVLQHADRAAHFKAIYPAPDAHYVPLAYNPLYYLIAAPFFWIAGASLPLLRFVAVLGYGAALLASFEAVRWRTQSRFWGLIAAGLLAAAYASMDAYLDNAHADSWLIASVLIGFLLLDRARTSTQTLAGIAMLCAAFWFKQPGAVFAAAGLAFVIWRDGLRASGPAILLAVCLGPILYLGFGNVLFGTYFHYFTSEVPASWSGATLRSLGRCVLTVALGYPILLAAGLTWSWHMGLRRNQNNTPNLTVWHFALLGAAASVVLAALDAGGLRNTVAPAGAIILVVGTIGIGTGALKLGQWTGRPLPATLLAGLAFASLLYDPRLYLVSSSSAAAYADLIGVLGRLDGPVASPSLGQLPSGIILNPAILNVANDDIARGRYANAASRELSLRLQQNILETPRPAYLLLNVALEDPTVSEMWAGHYTLLSDFGTRFSALAGMPRTILMSSTYPRYLYARKEPKS